MGYWRRCSFEVLFGLVTVRDGKVLGDMSSAGAGAALGCFWGCCLEVLVTVRAHMDGRVPGRVLFHDASDVVAALSVVCDGAWFVAGVSS